MAHQPCMQWIPIKKITHVKKVGHTSEFLFGIYWSTSVILGHFLHLTFLTIQKIKIEKKMKKEFGDVIILHICIKDHHYKMYASSDMECNRHNFLSFWAISRPFTSLSTPKIKNWKKCEMQKMPGDLTFHICVPWMKMIWCMVPGMSGAMELFIILDHFSPMTLLTTQNVKILKKWKNCLDILSFYTSVS